MHEILYVVNDRLRRHIYSNTRILKKPDHPMRALNFVHRFLKQFWLHFRNISQIKYE